MSVRGGEYYTTKGQGSQESYDAYYAEYGNSSVWQGVNVDTQSNIAIVHHGGEGDIVSTADSIERKLEQLGLNEGMDLKLILLGIVAFIFLK